MKVLFDTNVVLDVIAARQPHALVAAQLFALVDTGGLQGALCATTLTTVHYLATKAIGDKQAQEHIRVLMAMFEVAPVDRAVLTGAMDLGFRDFEDAVLHEAARGIGATAIVTRNTKDFGRAKLRIFFPSELLAAILASS